MKPQFVFQHSMTVVSNMRELGLNEIFTKQGSQDNIYIGHPTIFKSNSELEKFQFGYQVIDPDLVLTGELSSYHLLTFPVAEYIFTIHEGPFTKIGNTYDLIERQLDFEGLNSIFHPILNFPLGIPINKYAYTNIELWTATDANYSAEFRRSEQIQEALPRRRFNFYTW